MHVKKFPFSAADAARIESALRTYHAKIEHRITKVWFKFVDVDHVLTLITSGEANAFIVDNSYLVVVDVGIPWYSKSVILVEEQMVLKLLDGGAPFTSVTDFLHLVGEQHKAAAMVAGTALAPVDEAVARLYQRQGFSVQCQSLAKLME